MPREVVRQRDMAWPDLDRRQAIQCIGAFAISLAVAPMLPVKAGETGESAFAAGSFDEALAALGAAPTQSSQIALVVADFVENGSVVPVEITSHFSGEQDIYILSEANPYPLVAHFFVPEGTDPFVSTRIKVAKSCNIHAVIRSKGQFYSASKATTVTIGGCGA